MKSRNSSDLADMINKDSIESAYCFFHQKERIYQHSTLDWQQDDIEYAVENYVSVMSEELYARISGGRNDFLRNHPRFQVDIHEAVTKLEEMLSPAP